MNKGSIPASVNEQSTKRSGLTDNDLYDTAQFEDVVVMFEAEEQRQHNDVEEHQDTGHAHQRRGRPKTVVQDRGELRELAPAKVARDRLVRVRETVPEEAHMPESRAIGRVPDPLRLGETTHQKNAKQDGHNSPHYGDGAVVLREVVVVLVRGILVEMLYHFRFLMTVSRPWNMELTVPTVCATNESHAWSYSGVTNLSSCHLFFDVNLITGWSGNCRSLL